MNKDQVFYASVKDFIDKQLVAADVVDSERQTIAHVAVRNGDIDILEYVVAKKRSILEIKDKDDRTVIELAVVLDSLEAVKCLVEKFGADYEGFILKIVCTYEFSSRTHFLFGYIVHLAVKLGRINILKYFIEERRIDIDNPYFSNCDIPLVWIAIIYQRDDIIKYLVEEKNADLTRVGRNDENILFETVRAGNLNFLEYVLDEKKTKLDIDYRNADGQTVVHIAVLYKRTNILDYLVVQKRANINEKDKSGDTPLHIAACLSDDITEYLLEKGAALNASNKKGTTPLHLAIEQNNFKLFANLIKRGADVNHQDKNGVSGLHIVLSNTWDTWREYPPWPYPREDRQKMCTYLVNHGANVSAIDSWHRTPLYYAILQDWGQISRLLIARGCIQVDDDNKAIHLAATLGREEVMKCLIGEEYECKDINLARKSDHWTPLHCAAFSDHYKAVKYLVKYGANTHSKDKYGKVPAEVASNERIITYLNRTYINNISKKRNRRSIDRPVTTFLSLPLPGNVYNNVADPMISQNQLQNASYLSANSVTAAYHSCTQDIHVPSFLTLFRLLVPSFIPQQPVSTKAILQQQIDSVTENVVVVLSDFAV